MSDGGYRIGYVAKQTGLSVTVLRAWESRYGLGPTTRTTGGQRLYSEDDIWRIRRVKELASRGLALEAAARRASARSSLVDRLSDTDTFAALAAYEATRKVIRAVTPDEAVAAVTDLVGRLGGAVVAPGSAGGEELPYDLGLGARSPVVPAAPEGTLARMRLESVVPLVVEDARRIVHSLILDATPAGG